MRIRFAGEAGLHAGGLRCEFGSLLVSTLFSSEAMLFEGSDDRNVPVYNADAVHSNLFHLAGKICAYLLSHLDFGVSCLSPVIYSYITTDEVHEASKQCTLEDIPDYDLRKFIEEVYMWMQLVKPFFFWILVFAKFTLSSYVSNLFIF